MTPVTEFNSTFSFPSVLVEIILALKPRISNSEILTAKNTKQNKTKYLCLLTQKVEGGMALWWLLVSPSNISKMS